MEIVECIFLRREKNVIHTMYLKCHIVICLDLWHQSGGAELRAPVLLYHSYGNYLTCRFKNLWLQIISNSLPSVVRSTFGRKNSAGGTVFSLNSNEKMKRIMAGGSGIVFHYKCSVLWIVSYTDLPCAYSVPTNHWLLAQCQHSIAKYLQEKPFWPFWFQITECITLPIVIVNRCHYKF